MEKSMTVKPSDVKLEFVCPKCESVISLGELDMVADLKNCPICQSFGRREPPLQEILTVFKMYDKFKEALTQADNAGFVFRVPID